MATIIQQIHPVAHLPLVLGVLRRLEVAPVIDRLIPPHPAHGRSCGRGVEALVLAMLDGPHAFYKVGRRLEEWGMLLLLQPGLTRAALNDYRLGHILDALFAANLNKVFGAMALKALEVYAISTPWLHQDTPPPFPCMARMRTSRGVRRHLPLPPGRAKMGGTISNRCC